MKKRICIIAFGWLIIYITSYMVKSVIKYNSNDIKDFYLAYFSYLPISQNIRVTDFIVPIVHIIFVVYIFSGYVLNDIKEKGVIIFTRTDKKERWILKEYIKIFLRVNLYFLLQFTLFFILGIINNMHVVNMQEFISVISILFIVQVLSSYVLVVLSNTVSLYSNNIYGYYTSVVGFCANIVMLNELYTTEELWIIKYAPFTQHLILLDELKFINRNIYLFNIKIQNYDILTNGAVYLLILTVLIYISIKKMKTIDIL
ncbi:DUF2705 family protein [Clostridium beijerinckii]|uniref:DUF2705 family protein n=1 Tax=Clostridium beijerinckii TaxID=1520 RepID=UPI00098C70CE|nr:DUF2705 family protein [Clostridium beijerinckii]NRT78425.1 hypothetical protein [Clostridium beijerinckii]OOM47306.1 hypothetical protein CBEIJ_28720 [Clostridium beijerinckii]